MLEVTPSPEGEEPPFALSLTFAAWTGRLALAVCPVSSLPNCVLVKHVSPLSSETQSLSVWTSFANIFPKMPTVACTARPNTLITVSANAAMPSLSDCDASAKEAIHGVVVETDNDVLVSSAPEVVALRRGNSVVLATMMVVPDVLSFNPKRSPTRV